MLSSELLPLFLVLAFLCFIFQLQKGFYIKHGVRCPQPQNQQAPFAAPSALGSAAVFIPSVPELSAPWGPPPVGAPPGSVGALPRYASDHTVLSAQAAAFRDVSESHAHSPEKFSGAPGLRLQSFPGKRLGAMTLADTCVETASAAHTKPPWVRLTRVECSPVRRFPRKREGSRVVFGSFLTQTRLGFLCAHRRGRTPNRVCFPQGQHPQTAQAPASSRPRQGLRPVLFLTTWCVSAAHSQSTAARPPPAGRPSALGRPPLPGSRSVRLRWQLASRCVVPEPGSR